MAKTIVPWLWTLLISLAIVKGEVNIGVNWGNIASHPLQASIVVGMLKDNGIKKVKLFDANGDALSALAGSGIQVMVAIPNDMLEKMNHYKAAKEWVKKNVTKYLYDGGVDIRYVAVGNEPFLSSYNGSFQETTFPALKNIQKALEEAGHGDKIKASIPLNGDVYESPSNMPSSGDFRGDIKDLMVEIANFLKEKGSPFIVNIYPFLSLYQNPDFPENFCFFDQGGRTIHDKGNSYDNVFYANYDTLAWVLKKHGVGDLEIIVGEIGWPTDGHIKANVTYAKKFYDGLFKKLASNKGTPMRPGHIEVYLFGLLDEDMKSIAPGNFERHWGLFRFDGQPKFPMDLSGKGSDKMLVGAKGVPYLENKWCVFNIQAKNQDKIGDAIGYACSNADCTSLEYGSSCNNLDDQFGNASYAFNMFFQMNDQSVEACSFDGLAIITSTNASQKGCFFPIQIESVSNRIRLSLLLVNFSGFLLLLCMFL